MSFPRIEGAQHALTEAEIVAVEREFGITFPPELRQFYLEFNGGAPVPNRFPANGAYMWVKQFFPIKYGNPNLTFEARYRRLVLVSEAVSPTLIPFGNNPGGDAYCCSIADHDYGAVCVLYFENDDPEIYLAPSLNAFLSGLVPDPDK